MIITHIAFGLEMGGIESMLVNISNVQVGMGHEVHLFILNDMVNRSLVARLDPHVKLHLLGRPVGSKNPVYFIKLNAQLYRVHPDVVHLHYSKLSPFIILPSLRKRFCVTLHSPADDDSVAFMKSSGPVFSISNLVKEGLKVKYGIDSKVIYNGVDISDIKVKESGAGSKPFRIVQVARLDHVIKGQDTLIHAAAELKREGVDDFFITFIGDGSSREYLESLVSELEVGDKVRFLGTRSQDYLFEHLRDYDLLVHPARKDGFALTVAEAMVAGVPVMVTETQGPYEVIEYGKYGFSFKEDDYKGCASLIRDLMAKGTLDQKSVPAREFACSNYDVRVTASRYIEEYRHL